MDITCVGDIAVDYISTVNDFPEKNSNSEILEFSRSFGGSAANTAIICARLGVKTRLYACIGPDFPQEYLNELDYLALRANLYKSTLNTTTAMLYSNGEEQLTFFYRGASQHLNEIEPPKKVLNSKIIHLCRDFTHGFKKIIKQTDAQISFNPGYGLDEINKTELEYLLQHTHILFINEHEQEYLKQLFDLEDIRSLGPDIVVLTLGSRGCKVFSEHEVSVKAIPTTLIDPTGAGDSFNAGFLVGYLKEYSLDKCARIGSAVASITIGTRDTHPKITWEKVRRLAAL